MKLLVSTALLLVSLPLLAQQPKDKAPMPQTSQARPQPGPGPGPGMRPPMDFETMKKQMISRLEKRILIMESGKSCAEGAKDGPAFGECMKKMGETHRAEDEKIRAQDEKLRAEAERRGPPPINNQPTKFKIDEVPKTPTKIRVEESKPEVKKK